MAGASLLWRVLTPVVLAAAAVDAWRLARTQRRGPEVTPVPDRLTLSRDVRAAPFGRAECVAFLDAGQAQEQRRYPDAVAAYRAFRTASPQSVLQPFVTDQLRRTYGSWSAALRTDRAFGAAIGVYRDLLAEVGRDAGAAQVRTDLAATYVERAADTRARMTTADGDPSVDTVTSAVDDLLVVRKEFPETPAATTVPRALTETYAAATGALGQQRFCDALPVLRYFAGLPADAGDLAGTANADRARALLECGLGEFRAGRPGEAIDPLTELATAYPDDPGTAQARSAVIAARVAVQTELPVTLPAPLGDDSPGSIPVAYHTTARTRSRSGSPGRPRTSSSSPPAADARPTARSRSPRATGGRPARRTRCTCSRASTSGR